MSFYYRIGVQAGLTQTERENNANEIYNYFSYYGATLDCICGMLGNWQWESGLNPGCKQGLSTSLGWGLIQWTPSTVLTDWCNRYNYNWYDGYAQCYRIWCEGTNQLGAGGVWIPTTEYPYTWSEFLALTDRHEAVKAWLYERGRGAPETLHVAERLQYSDEWYQYFTGSPTPPIPPVPPTPPTPIQRRKKMPLYMMLRRF